MRKNEAIAIFGTPGALAAALGRTPQAIYQWPKNLSQDQTDLVVGAAVRLGKMSADGSRLPVPKKEASA